MLKKEIDMDERKTMSLMANIERGGSELDTHELPESTLHVDWREFNVDFLSTKRKPSEVSHISDSHMDQRIDLRPYMIHSPYMCNTTDRFQKVLDIYRNMQLKTIGVINPIDGTLQGIISRKNLFSYMSL